MIAFQTIETTATVDENGVLKAALVGVAPGEVRVFVMVAAPQAKEEDHMLEEIDEKTWHRGIAGGGLTRGDKGTGIGYGLEGCVSPAGAK